MKIEVKRIARRDTYTIGKLYIDDKYMCDTLEDTDRGLTDSMSVDDIKGKKVYGKTAIPSGTYKVSWTYSNKFKKYLPLIENVKGFEGIRIHSGNIPADTYGCLLLGQNKVVGKVINSRDVCNKVLPMIENACKSENVTIKIS